MYFWHKRRLIGALLLVYCISYFLQSWFFVDMGSVFAKDPLNKTHLIAVFVDKDIYNDSKNDIEWYTTKYIQKRVSNSKAIVLPINTQNFKAIDLVKILENIYFDGIEDAPSDLLGIVLIGDIPLPVVQNKGFVYPSIFPYVDFEDQQFIYDNNQQFFISNNNPKGQAEIWHGIINFKKDQKKYNDFFEKLKKYANSPSDFVAPLLWYDDFVGMKSSFSKEALPFYVNNFLFTEDIGYHRFTNVMLDYFKKSQNDGIDGLLNGLASVSKNNPELSAVLSEGASSFDSLENSKVPTTMIFSIIKELMKGYETLYPGLLLSTMKTNTQAASRWYKTTADGNLVDGIDSHIQKIVIKDSLVLGNLDEKISPMFVNFNDAMEKSLDAEIENKKLYMTIPILTSYTANNRTKQAKYVRYRCEQTTSDKYDNYYFGKYAGDITSLQDLSIYRGTFGNLTSFSGVLLQNSDLYLEKSLGASNNLFATQVESNRGYNSKGAVNDYTTYKANSKKVQAKVVCTNWQPFGLQLYCKNKAVEYISDSDNESINDFAIRGWGGASFLNLDTGSLAKKPSEYLFKIYDFKSDQFPIYDVGGSIALKNENSKVSSFAGLSSFSSLIKVKDRYGAINYPKYIKGDFDDALRPVYNIAGDGRYVHSGAEKITLPYNGYDYFEVFNKPVPRDESSIFVKKIYVGNSQKVFDPYLSAQFGDVRWDCSAYHDNLIREKICKKFGSTHCKGKKNEKQYSYITVDSRIKNTAPTPEHINGIQEGEFAENSLFFKHYSFLKKNFSDLDSKLSTSFLESYSGLNFLLTKNKEVNTNISQFFALNSSNTGILLASIKNIFPDIQQQSYEQIFTGASSSIENSISVFENAGFDDALVYFDRIEEIEKLYGKNTKFLSGWSKDLGNQLSSIKTKYNIIPGNLASVTGVYEQIKDNLFSTGTLIAKKQAINSLQSCNPAPNQSDCGCDYSYKEVCQSIDSLVDTLDRLSKEVTTLHTDPTTGSSLMYSLQTGWHDFSLKFSPDFVDVSQKLTKISTVNQASSKIIPGLNEGTSDRPIDSPRRVSFQGLGGTTVTFVYPNLYEVSVYKKEGSSLVLKTIPEIKQSILSYLNGKAKEYNTLLSAQENLRVGYYNSQKAAFDFLSGSDSLASPNHPTLLLKQDVFVDLIGQDRISDLAELLYYQSLPVYSKQIEQYVDKDLEATKSSFDLNQKIGYVLSGYLTKHQESPLLTPSYNASGYEVAYINSDRSDYITVADMPAFVQQIQRNQKPLVVANSLIESADLEGNEQFSSTLTRCSLDSSYSELLFDINEKQGKGKMPWITALQCWWSTLGSSVKFNMSLEVGPSFSEFFSSLDSTLSGWKSSMKKLNSSPALSLSSFSGNTAEYWTNLVLFSGDAVANPQVKTMKIIMPAIKILAGTQFPIAISAQDASGNSISRSIDSYKLITSTGYFVGPAGTGLESSEFSDFDSTMIIYKAPLVVKNTPVSFHLSGFSPQTKSAINVVPGDFVIEYNGNSLDLNKKSNNIVYMLTGIDATYSSVPRLYVSISADVQTPFSIVSKNGFLQPGIISNGKFIVKSSFFVDSNVDKKTIFLMPNYRVGEDELVLQIPGREPIVIPVSVVPGAPYRVKLDVSKSIVSPGESLSGAVSVSDERGNAISGSTFVKLGSAGALELPGRVSVSKNPGEFLSKAKTPGGVSYLYAFLEGIPLSQQSPDYKKITVQENFLPKKNLNVMYLNLFGSDWGNMRNNQQDTGYIPDLISSSEKLLTVTTQLTDPSSIKKFLVMVSDDGQIHNFSDHNVSLQTLNGSLYANILGVGSFSLAKNDDIKIFSSADGFKSLSTYKKTALLFQPESSLDLKSFPITDKSFSFGEEMLIDFENNLWNSGLSLSLSKNLEQGYSVWSVSYKEEIIGKMFFVRPNIKHTISDISLYQSIAYGVGVGFAEGTTNGKKGIGIIDLLGTFEKEGYTSLEDSAKFEDGIGFVSDFKNITLFGDGKSVGESTIPFGSHFLINFGDPLLSRISDAVPLKSVDFDLGVGKTIYSDPTTSIFKTLSADFNKDGLKDVLVVSSDGTIKLLKNYGGTNPYSNLQDLFRLSDSIKDVFVGDVDNNGYPDILVWTTNDSLRVYKNNKGIFDVDGSLICLNINASGEKQTSTPESVKGLEQLFFEDMDKDGNIDIITNDLIGDIKIFYGGKNSKGQGNYVSSLSYACDSNWYSRQKPNTQLVKSYGITVDPDYYIQDQSMVHIKGWTTSMIPENKIDTSKLESELNKSIPDINSLMSSITDLSKNSSPLKLSTSPLHFVPEYENLQFDDIGYKYISDLSGDNQISVYKKYQDINGGVLLSGDVVKITTTILPLENGIKATYFDSLVGPFDIITDDKNQILSFAKESENFSTGNIKWLADDKYFFVLDGLNLNAKQEVKYSYTVVYQGSQTVLIDIKDVVIGDVSPIRKKDSYLDIVVSPFDSCKKYRWVFFNTGKDFPKKYEEYFDNIQAKLDAYTAAGQAQGQQIIDDSLPKPPTSNGNPDSTAESMQGMLSNLMNNPGLSNIFESWKKINVSDLFSSSNNPTTSQFNMGALDSIMAPVSQKMDKMLDGLCQGFKLGSASCQPPVPFNMIPFNQAFLAPGDYHLFGCTPKAPHPLAPLFKIINDKLGKGFPILFFPGTLPILVPIPMIGSSFVPIVQQNYPGTDGFGLFATPGTPVLPLGAGVHPSMIRLYLVPTLTLQMGVAMCFGPYQLGTKIPRLFKDLGGNCIVTAFPLYKCNGSSTTGTPSTEELPPWITDLASNGVCEQPIIQGSTKILANTYIEQQPTQSSPFRLSSVGAQSSSWTSAVPNGNFGGFGYLSLHAKPTKKSINSNSTKPSSVMDFEAFEFIQGPSIDLKIKDTNAQGIAKVLVKDWLGKQIKYMVNNLTKFTINITLPDVGQLAGGFDNLFSSESWSNAKSTSSQDDVNPGLTLTGLALEQRSSMQTVSSSVNNPFESLITMFESIPLVDLYTKDINIKIPLIGLEPLIEYKSYLLTWLKNQQTTLKQWLETIHELASICGKMSPLEAKIDLESLEKEIVRIKTVKDDVVRQKLLQSAEKEKIFLKDIIDGNVVTQDSNIISDDIPAVFSDMGRQFGFFSKKLVAYPRLSYIKQCLQLGNLGSDCSSWSELPQKERTALILRIDERMKSLSTCSTFSSSLDDFSAFYVKSTELVKNIQKNIQTLEKYKQFPSQLYNWINYLDTTMSELVTFVSRLSSTLIGWVNVNAKLYDKWVDSLILILTAIKTRQVLIDLSTNWTKKCSKCSQDGYGSYNCSLSFLFPEIPIIPIPPFKIPNINIDLSHIDLGISIALPRINFTPIELVLPKLPNLPYPPEFNLAGGFDFSVNFGNLSLPEIPLLPEPPVLPELPSFIPKVDFSLPTLPPAPKIPNIIPEVSSVIEIADFVAKIFCIVKQGVGLVGEKGVKARVEQLTQRTWEVPMVDALDQTTTWNTTTKLQGFDLQLDAFVQFKMDFSAFFVFLDQIANIANSFSYGLSSDFSKKTAQISSGLNNNPVSDFLNTNIRDVNYDFTPPSLNIDIGPLSSNVESIDYSVAYKKLLKGLSEFENRVDDPRLKQDILKLSSILNTPIVIKPATKEIELIQKKVQNIVYDKQKEIRDLAKSLSSYDSFIARVERNDIALVNDDKIQLSFSSPLFTTNKETYSLIKQQESPIKAYLDTNATLVSRYLGTLSSSSPAELGMKELDYKKSSEYLTTVQSKIDSVYDTLGFEKLSYSSCGVPSLNKEKNIGEKPLLSQSSSTSTTATTSSMSSAGDISSYVNGIFVESESGNMVNVVKSDVYIKKIGDDYFSSDLNSDQKDDIVMRDSNNVYVKYSKPNNSEVTPKQLVSVSSSYYDYSPGIWKSLIIDSYNDLVNKSNDDGYVSFGGISIKLISPIQEVKNFDIVGQSFDAVQMSWKNSSSLGESVDGYLIKMNHRIDTHYEKDEVFSLFEDDADKYLNKRYILVLPSSTSYTGAKIDFKERFYYKGKDAKSIEEIDEFLSGGTYSGLIVAIKTYDNKQDIISLGIQDIPRNWQYAKIIPLKNEGTISAPVFIPSGPWSNQVVAGKQKVDDTIGPEAVINLIRPSTQEVISTGSNHKGFVGTTYTLNAIWKDNIAVSRMWIQQGDSLLASSLGLDGQDSSIKLSGLYFTGESNQEYLVGAEDVNGNTQIEKVLLDISVPKITVKSFIPISEFSGKIVAELSNDIDEGMVVFQRQRNNVWSELSGTLSNTAGGFSVKPKQTIVTGSVFTIGNTLGLYDQNGNEIGQISVDGNVSILSKYQDKYKIVLDITSGYPLVGVIDLIKSSRVFWIQMPSTSISKIDLKKGEPFYTKVDLVQSSFGSFVGGYCIQSLDKQCILYTSPLGRIYIPKTYSSSLKGDYYYDNINRLVIYKIKDSFGDSILDISVKVRIIK